MTQILACCSPDGLVLGTDSRARHYLEDGSIAQITVHKLFRLSPHLVLATAGAGYGIALCRAFQAHVQQKGLWQFEEISYQALPFFRSELERLKREGLLQEGRAELARVYFVIAGRDLNRREDPFQLCLLGSEQQGDPLHSIANAGILAIPRRLAMEAKLVRLQQAHKPLLQIRAAVKRSLAQLVQETDEVGPPLHLVSIGRDGIETERF